MKITTAAGVDVTEAVQVLYDALFHWVDMASGFLDTDEKDAVRHIARAAGFKPPEFGSDMCTCGHERDYHDRLHKCLKQIEVRPRRTEKRKIENPMPQCGHEEHRTPPTWITVETDPGESVKCECSGFEWVGDTPPEDA